MSSFLNEIEKKIKIVALNEKVSKELIEKLHNSNKQKHQEILNNFVNEREISGDDLLDLMYDLNKYGFSRLSRPVTENPALEKIKKGEIDKDLGEMLLDASQSKINEITKYFKNNPKAFGVFISQAEKNKIGFYENDLRDLPITKEALEQVDDEYLLNSILYSSVYGTKEVTDDAIAYAYDRFKNPFKQMLDNGRAPDLFALAAGHFADKNSDAFRTKMRKWFQELPEIQKEIAEDFLNDESLLDWIGLEKR